MSDTYTHTKTDPILTVDGVTRHFGGMTAVDVDHLEVQRGTITALIGPNGAGKTTFFNLLTGFDKPSPGATTRFNGDTLQKTSATHIANKGMVRTFQLTKALSRLTVMQNMLLGARDQPGENFFVGLIPALWRKREREITAKAEDLLARFKLLEKKDDYAGSLSPGAAEAPRDGPGAHVRPDDDHARRADGRRREPGAHPVAARAHPVPARRRHDRPLRRARHAHGPHISDWVVVMAEGKVVAEGRPTR